MRRDFEILLKSPEASLITIKYFSTGSEPETEAPSHEDETELVSDPEVLEIPSIHKTISERDLKALKFQLLEVGDSLFYISKTVNIAEPVPGKPIAPGTLSITDPSGIEWVPQVIDKATQEKLAAFHVGSISYCTVIACKNKK